MDTLLLIGLLHLAIIVPFLLYVGFNRAATPEWMYSILFGTGILIMVYHGYKAAIRIMAASPVVGVTLIHVLLIGPLLLWIGYYAKRTERPAYDMLLISAFGALGYHLYKLVVISQTFLTPREV